MIVCLRETMSQKGEEGEQVVAKDELATTHGVTLGAHLSISTGPLLGIKKKVEACVTS